MIAYSRNLLNNLLIAKKARTWFANGLISPEQMATINNKYPAHYYNPNLFVRMGLFLFMWIMIFAALGLYSLMTWGVFGNGSSGTIHAYGIITSILFAGLSFLILEKFIKEKSWFGNGMDDALLYCGLGSICSLIILFFSNNLNESDSFLIVCFLYLPVLIAAAMRYLDRLVTLAALVCFYCLFFRLIMLTGEIAKFIMPFAFMALSAGIFFSAVRFLKKPDLVHYNSCLKVIKATALIVFYISGNYFVIRESSVEFFGLNLGAGEDIPLAFLFYAFTALVPLVFLFFGLKKKDKLLVWVALLLITVSVLTFKYYFSLGRPEITLTMAGLVMIILAYRSIRYLSEDKYGITFKDDPNEDSFMKSNAEALVIAGSFGSASTPTNGEGVEFGGGEFGGAGSGNKY